MDDLFTEVNPVLKLVAKCKTPPCAFGGVHQPRFWEGGKEASSMVLFENFFHSSNALNMPSGPGSSVTVEDFVTTGSKWCSLDWSFVSKTGDMGSKQHGIYSKMEDEKEKKMCFSMAYMASFLRALGMPQKYSMAIMGDIRDTPIGNADMRINSCTAHSYTYTYTHIHTYTTHTSPNFSCCDLICLPMRLSLKINLTISARFHAQIVCMIYMQFRGARWWNALESDYAARFRVPF